MNLNVLIYWFPKKIESDLVSVFRTIFVANLSNIKMFANVSAQQLNFDAQMTLRSGKKTGIKPYDFAIDNMNRYYVENRDNVDGIVLRSGNTINNSNDSYVLLRSGRLVGKQLDNPAYTSENTMTLRSGRHVNANAYTDAYIVM